MSRGKAAAALVTGEVRHLPSVGKVAGEWRMTCTCGAEGAARATRRMASADWDAHLIEVCDVPPAERCRMNREHRLQPWERCALCAGQLELDLFDSDGDVREVS